jgi:hypothetical protein
MAEDQDGFEEHLTIPPSLRHYTKQISQSVFYTESEALSKNFTAQFKQWSMLTEEKLVTSFSYIIKKQEHDLKHALQKQQEKHLAISNTSCITSYNLSNKCCFSYVELMYYLYGR